MRSVITRVFPVLARYDEQRPVAMPTAARCSSFKPKDCFRFTVCDMGSPFRSKCSRSLRRRT